MPCHPTSFRCRRACPGWLRRTLAALAVFAAAEPAALAQTPPTLSNTYNLSGFINPTVDTWLNSYVSCGLVRCDIAYSVVSRPLDRFVQVVWKDTANQPLISASNAYLSNFYDPVDFGGYVEATEWSKGVLLGGAAPAQAVGTADFTGTSAGVAPCSAGGYVCHDADYYYWPSMWGTPPAPPPVPRLGQAGAAARVTLGSIVGTLSNVGIDVNQPADIGDRRVVFLEFSSSVDFDTDHYVYRYTVTNSTDLRVPFTWSAAGLGQTIEAHATLSREFSSADAPAVFASLPSWTLTTDSQFPFSVSFANGLEIFAPVPEPASGLQLVAGLALLGLARRRLATHRPPLAKAAAAD